jgi:tRNA modification GTPase
VNSPARETIYALSSGSPPAAIAVIRLSGPRAADALVALGGRLPAPRQATLAALRHPRTGEILDNGLVLHFPAPASATGEDVAELHLHGGRSVVAAVLAALETIDGLRPAAAGEFTRRAFDNGRIDLTEAEGLADLLLAETQSQRRAALALAGGSLTRQVEDWQQQVLALGAAVEAALDFADEDDVAVELPAGWHEELAALADALASALARPPAERLRDGIKVVIAGPPNAGKSTLLNALAGREAAITSAIAGTTRDLVEAPTAIDGTPLLLIDTAGLRASNDEIEAIGVARAEASIAGADLILWLGDPEESPDRSRTIVVRSKCDVVPPAPGDGALPISPVTGAGMDALAERLIACARRLLPSEADVPLNARHRAALRECLDSLCAAQHEPDILLVAEALRLARASLDRVTGSAGVENMLDSLFGRLCIGK